MLCVLFFLLTSVTAVTVSLFIVIVYSVLHSPVAGSDISKMTQYSLLLLLHILFIVQLIAVTSLVFNSVTSSSKKHFKA